MKLLFFSCYLLFFAACLNLVTNSTGIRDFKISTDSINNSENLIMRISGKLDDSALRISSYKIDYNKDYITIEIERIFGENGYNGPYEIQFYVPQNVNKVVLGNSETIWNRKNN